MSTGIMKTTRFYIFKTFLYIATINTGIGQNDITLSIIGGGGYASWVDVIKNVTFYDASGNVIENTQVKTVGNGPSAKVQSKILMHLNDFQFGVGCGFQRDFFDFYKTESDIAGLVEIDTTPILNNIYELEYYFIAGFNLFESGQWSGSLNFNIGSYYLHSDYENQEIKRKLHTGVECELNYLFVESLALQINPKYEYVFLSLDEPLKSNPNWSIHNVSAMVGLCKKF